MAYLLKMMDMAYLLKMMDMALSISISMSMSMSNNCKTMKIYVASSWRNKYFPNVVEALRHAGHDVYDFRNPPSGDEGFKWSAIGADWLDWTPWEYREHLSHPRAEKQFANDIEAMRSCDACVLLLPCGRSAHTEAGWFAGQGKKVFVLIPERQEPELMYKLFDGVCCSLDELVERLSIK